MSISSDCFDGAPIYCGTLTLKILLLVSSFAHLMQGDPLLIYTYHFSLLKKNIKMTMLALSNRKLEKG